MSQKLYWTFKLRKETIYLLIHLDGKQIYLRSIGYKASSQDWDQKRKRVKLSSKSLHINEILNELDNKLLFFLHEHRHRNVVITKAAVVDLVNPEEPIPETDSFMDLYREHNQKIKALVGITYSDSTHKKYVTTLKHLQNYLHQLGKKDLPVKSVNISFIEAFQSYLLSEGLSINTTLKYLTHIRKVILVALRRRMIQFNPFLDFTFSYEKKPPKYLTLDELSRIEMKRFKIERLEKVRHLYLFGCYTGLAFADLKRFDAGTDLQRDADGNYYLIYQRVKTDQPALVPVSKKAIAILEIYDWELPKLSNQKMNAYLHEIADICEISKNLTSHTARHTFATSALTRGVSKESVQKLLGHSDPRSTEIYAQVTPNKLMSEMKRAGLI